MIFTGRSVDALDEVRGGNVQADNRRDVSAVAIAAGWFSSLRRPGKRNKKGYQKQAKSAWDLSTLSTQLKDELGEVVAEMEAMEGGGLAADETKPSNKAKQTSIGRKKFNMDPKKGIEYLIEHNLLAPTPEDVAQFLYKGEGLNKTAIGDYLGERHDFNERVLRAFVELHDFTDLILVQALRQFLWSFRLPGEAQKIDRMMECFAQRYCQLNPNIFTNTDTCYVLSFAIIMLNTSLHNPSVKDKPSVEQFISMNRGINNGGDLPRELLVSLYESIKTEPFKIPEDDGNDLMHTFFNPDKEGWLWKQESISPFRFNRFSLESVPHSRWSSPPSSRKAIRIVSVVIRVVEGYKEGCFIRASLSLTPHERRSKISPFEPDVHSSF